MRRFHRRHLTITALTVGGLMAAIGTWAGLTNGPDGTVSPLAAYIGLDSVDLLFNTTNTEQARSDARAERQAAIAACMDTHGFHYQPTTPHDDDPTDPVSDPTSRDYAQTYGFGITTLAFSQDQVGEHLTGYTPTNPTALEAVNPNVETVNDLDPDQRAAYLKALTGRDTTDPDQPVTPADLAPTAEPGGCQRDTQEGGADLDAFYAEFNDDLTQLRHDILTDPDVTRHLDHIATCVTDQHLDYIPPDQLHQHWADDLQTIADATNNPATGNGSGLPDLPAQARADLLELQHEETTLALAIYDCGGSDTNHILSNTAHDHEEHFIENNRARLDAFNQR